MSDLDQTTRTVGAIAQAPFVWTPDQRLTRPRFADLSALTAIRRGARGYCPACGTGALFASWIRANAACGVCAAPLGEIRADDAPPYFTVFIVAHLSIALLLLMERNFTLSVATEMMMLLPVTLLATLLLMRPVKGATLGLMLKLGFMKPADEAGKGLGDG